MNHRREGEIRMLHSEDADINKVIRQIIDLDKRAIRIKKNVEVRAAKIIDKTKKEIAEREKIELEGVQVIVKNNYQNEIAKAEDERLSIIHRMEQDISKVHCRYDEKKDQKAQEILEILFKMENDNI